MTLRRRLGTVLAAAVLAAASGSAGAQDPDSAAEAVVTVVNAAPEPVTAVMTETPTAAVVQAWPRVLEPGAAETAAFSFPAMTGAVSMVQYALPPESDGDTRTCLFRWRADASAVVRCAAVLTAQRIGVGAVSCNARLVEQDPRTCSFRAVFEVR
ncbi:hypothetical protein C882_0461 [Caenispirillum salinarum AK4]|uniref:Uncharacterized protein n=1 Tax=Caenispirillum salinarum AK4 TaxID=1238182 RepID=K9GWN9_9PROT|nr:hypothetical protein [Caenispirillum salinarum]EKV29154.1 hypothetical protein C882_0461 [Caenispirillum salinarum AK4]